MKRSSGDPPVIGDAKMRYCRRAVFPRQMPDKKRPNRTPRPTPGARTAKGRNSCQPCAGRVAYGLGRGLRAGHLCCRGASSPAGLASRPVAHRLPPSVSAGVPPEYERLPSMSSSTRRTFLKQSLVAAAGTSAFAIAGTKVVGRVLGANDTIRIAIAGLNGRGREHVKQFSGMENVQITYLVDPDERAFGTRIPGSPIPADTIKDKTGVAPKLVKDIRKVLDDPNVDAITIATPNHWHSLMTIWACQAGKDVYVEKPCSHNIHEGRIAVDTARKHNRIVQHGTQSRSSNGWAGAVEFVRAAQAGKLLVSRALCYKPSRQHRLSAALGSAAATRFQSVARPGAEQPYHKNLVPYNWHWFWDTGNGDIGNQGVHQMDHRPLGHSRRDAAQERDQPRRPLRLRRSGTNAELADLDHGLRRRRN